MKVWTHESVKRFIKETNNPNPIEEIQLKARDLVLQAMTKGWDGPPFSAMKLAELLGIEITPNDSVSDARLLSLGKKNAYKLEYNPFQKPTRINFSVAHEIVHTFFSDCAQKIRNREESPLENRELEQLCNIGASEIQLPYGIFSKDANEIDSITIESLVDLATKYKSSLEALFIRFTQVIDRPCAILICGFENNSLKTIYSTVSKSFKYKIPDSFRIPKNSVAHECITPGWTARETIKWNFLDEAYDSYCVGLSPLRREKISRVGIIIAPNNGNEPKQSENFSIEYGDATKPRGDGIKIIAQVINTSGGLGIGFGKALSKNYPAIKVKLKEWKENKNNFVLGESNLIKITDDLYIHQMLAQKGLYPQNGEIPLKYRALRNCLADLKNAAHYLNASVHMPLIGAGQAKGNWDVIEGMIHDELSSNGVKVNVYMLPGQKFKPTSRSNLNSFNEKSTWQKEK